MRASELSVPAWFALTYTLTCACPVIVIGISHSIVSWKCRRRNVCTVGVRTAVKLVNDLYVAIRFGTCDPCSRGGSPPNTAA
jgi:hypothetical protein